MSSNIINDISNYFENLRETEGDLILIDGDPISLNVDDVQVEGEQNKSNFVKKPARPKPIMKKITIIENKVPEDSVDKSWSESTELSALQTKIENCLRCPLGTQRNKFVFGTGNPNADIMIIGEAPGADEDKQGKPFVGRSGQLLTKILEAIDLSREDVFIANIIKCRPPKNRRPEKTEVEKCEPYLIKQIELIKPEFILALGLTAVETLLKEKHKMGDIRGKIFDYHGTKLLVTYHPAALLRNPHWKKAAWEDMQKLRDMYLELKNKS